MIERAEIPLFPLGTVLFPGGPLPLRIFETRYIDLVRRCLRDGSGFGVVMIREGVEAGGPALTFDVGTYARIVDFSQQPDGLLGIRAEGERRFRILERRRERDGLNVADVELSLMIRENSRTFAAKPAASPVLPRSLPSGVPRRNPS